MITYFLTLLIVHCSFGIEHSKSAEFSAEGRKKPCQMFNEQLKFSIKLWACHEGKRSLLHDRAIRYKSSPDSYRDAGFSLLSLTQKISSEFRV
jgi:hypothetical protein